MMETTQAAPVSYQRTGSEAATPFLYLAAKRCLDVVFSLVALVILVPVLLIIAVAVKLDSRGPVIFRQERVRGDQDPRDPHPERNTFIFCKFRTMYQDADQRIHEQYAIQFINGHNKAVNNGHKRAPIYKMVHDKRITRVGRFLRRTSLDELPQLFNVLKGDMTLVGPRPALPYEVAQFSEWARKRLAVSPGLTGLWQVSGRSSLTFTEMVALDIEYVEHRSLGMDLNLLVRTIPVVFSSKGAW
jgi:lipopolysaccharide/colanic/teichoic acid biosynthesis glycosyltransferase